MPLSIAFRRGAIFALASSLCVGCVMTGGDRRAGGTGSTRPGECRSNADCERGSGCVEGRCVAISECASNADCESGTDCVQGRCVTISQSAPHDTPCPETFSIAFAPGSAALDERARDRVDALSACLAMDSKLVVRLTGHGDGTGGTGAAVALGAARAQALATALAARGVAPGKIDVRSHGDDEPLCVDPVEACRARNRRVDVSLRRAVAANGKPKTKQVALVRYPSIESPAVMRPRRQHAVLVSLEAERKTPTIVTDGGGQVSPSGGTVVKVPEAFDVPDEEAWKVKVQLEMPGASVDRPVQTVLVRLSGPADVATFKVKPLWTPTTPQERRDMPIIATFSRKGRLFARAIRIVPVTADPAFEAPSEARELAQGGGFGDPNDRPDLFVQAISLGRVVAPEGAPGAVTERFLFQAQLTRKDALPVGAGDEVLMRGLDEFLKDRYGRLSTLARRSGDADPVEADRIATADAVRQLGADLWKLYTPEVVKDRIRRLQRAKPQGADVRFQTNDPRFPLELLLVPRNGNGDCRPGDDCELLGVLHRVSRWHVEETLGVSPGVRTREGTVAMIAPAYSNPLEAVEKERQTLERLAGDRFTSVTPGTFAKLVSSLSSQPFPAVLHYAGHGKAKAGTVPGIESYALRLEDHELDLATFQRHAAWLVGEEARGPLVFLNACEVGRGAGAHGWVDGWGPAALERGAAGFIGGLWELGDEGAADFVQRFYAGALAGKPVAEALREARAAYASAADPTYAAYVYYGHPDLQLSLPR